MVLFGPLENETSQIKLEAFCTEFTNWRKPVNILIRQLLYFQQFTSGNRIALPTASEDAQKTRERKDAENSKVGERGSGLFAKWPNEPGRYR